MNAPHPFRDLPRDPCQNPQNKMPWSTTVSFHLILSMQYHLTRRARSREVRLLGGIVPFAFSRVAFRVRWRSLTPHQDPHHKVKRSTRAAGRGGFAQLIVSRRGIAMGSEVDGRKHLPPLPTETLGIPRILQLTRATPRRGRCIGANLPYGGNAFRVGYRRGSSSGEPLYRFW